MYRQQARPSLTGLLGASAVGVYLLVVAGATAAVAEAARACGSWPTCTGPLTDPAIAIALGHRVAAVLVGGVLGWTAIRSLRSGGPAHVRVALVTAIALYPVQIALGALIATEGAALTISGFHLTVGLTIFATVVLALAWHLRAETGGADEPAPQPAPRSATASNPTPVAASSVGLWDRIVAYVRLTKPRLMWLLCLVALAGIALATLVTGTPLSPTTVVLTLGGGVLAIGASGTFNHVLERDRDRRMDRTADRPLVTHEVPAGRATVFGLVLAASSLVAFSLVNWVVAVLGLSAILFYSIVYTVVLKPNTVQNTVIGGAAGALPATIGWAAITGSVGLPGLALAGVIFVWTPAHFYNLALAYREDYERGGFPMMPVVRGESTTRTHILLWLGTTLAAAATLIWLTPLGWLAGATSVAVGAVFLWAVINLHREQSEQAALRAFHASNAYLGAFLAAVVVDALVV